MNLLFLTSAINFGAISVGRNTKESVLLSRQRSKENVKDQLDI